MELPKTLFVRLGEDHEEAFVAAANAAAAIAEDGPTEIGEYELVGKHCFEKIVQECDPAKSAASIPISPDR